MWRPSSRLLLRGKSEFWRERKGIAHIHLMLQTLLEDRFQMKVQGENKELPV
jgi:hypothetical protein